MGNERGLPPPEAAERITNNAGENIAELRAQLGEPNVPNVNPRDQVLKLYDRITIRRTSGEVEDDWHYMGLRHDGRMILSGKIVPGGKPLYHQDYFSQVAKWNNLEIPATKSSE